jgi:predicted GIY-YIG superfamily endonuclease
MPSAARTRKRKRRHHHSVYVVELSRGVLYERKFQRANPHYNPDKPCVYVGMTGLDPDVRFDKHKAGIQSNSYVRKYGVRLLPALYAAYNPMPYDAARDMEVELAIALREQGFGVWQG